MPEYGLLRRPARDSLKDFSASLCSDTHLGLQLEQLRAWRLAFAAFQH